MCQQILFFLKVYVAEIAQPQYRGVLSAITMPALATGTLLSYCLGAIIDWHFVAIIAAAIPIILIPGLMAYWILWKVSLQIQIISMGSMTSRILLEKIRIKYLMNRVN